MCYHGRTMAAAKRAGRTGKISISLDRDDVAWLKKRARRLYGGNVSAVAAEGVRRLREEEGRSALVEWLSEAAGLSPVERDAIRAEWQGRAESRRRRPA
jgi:hypothetical protein